jgi:hypothetical protein
LKNNDHRLEIGINIQIGMFFGQASKITLKKYQLFQMSEDARPTSADNASRPTPAAADSSGMDQPLRDAQKQSRSLGYGHWHQKQGPRICALHTFAALA